MNRYMLRVERGGVDVSEELVTSKAACEVVHLGVVAASAAARELQLVLGALPQPSGGKKRQAALVVVPYRVR